jgi:plasmid stabilization system protein ParE
MTFRVEITKEAEHDAEGILDWLILQQAGETGLRWFQRLDEAIASLATFPAAHSPPKTRTFPLRYVTCSMAAGHMFTG